MTDKEINIAIAEAVGWELRETEEMAQHFPGGWLPSKIKRWFRKSDGRFGNGFEQVPNYINDLNAMHEAEKIIIKFMVYEAELERVCKTRTVWNATARQRSEAFLRTIGKWND